MSEPIANLVRFLRRDPQPAAIRVYTIAGDEKMVRIAGNDSRRWSRCADTVEGLNAAKVECVDKAGHVIRVGELPEDEDKAAERTKTRDAFESNIAVVAKLLTQAAKDASAAHEAAYRLAFDKMVELTTYAFKRADALERAHNSLARRLYAQAGEGGEAEDPVSRLIEAFAGGALMRQQQNGGAPAPSTGGDDD